MADEPKLQEVIESIKTVEKWERQAKLRNKKAAVIQCKKIREQLTFLKDTYNFKFSM